MSIHNLIIQHVIPSEYTKNLQKNDVVTHINGSPATDYFANNSPISSHYHYEIQQASGKKFQIEAPVPIAVELYPSADYLLSAIKKGNYDWEDFEHFWENNQWEYLRQALAAIKPNAILAWLAKVLFKRHLNNDTPAMLFQGALHFHEGNKAEALAYIETFVEEGMECYTTNFHAIAYYYLALLAKDENDREYYFDNAHYHNNTRLEKINTQLKKEGFDLLLEDAGENAEDEDLQYFPIDLVLPNAYQPENTSLKRIIQHGQYDLTPICVMPAYRSNGPYQSVLEVYQQMWPYFKHHINPMVVLADEHDDKEFTDYWLGGERKVLAADIPLTVMMDIKNLASNRLGLTGSPTLFVINKQAEIVHYDLAEPLHYWALLNL